MRVVVLWCLLALSPMTFNGCQKERAESIKLINEGIQKENLGNVEVAYALYARAIAIDPTNHRAHFQMAVIDLYDKKQLDKARDRLLEAERLVADDRDVLYQLGRYSLAIDKPDYDKAIAYFDKALAADPNYAPASYWKGYALMQKDDGPGADKALREAIALEPKYAPAWRDLGELYERFDQTATAAEVYKRGLEFADDTTDILNSLGHLAMSENRPKDAIIHFEKAMQQAGQRNDLVFNLAMAFVAADDVRNAFRYLGDYINRSDGTNPEAVKIAHILRNSALERLEKEKRGNATP